MGTWAQIQVWTDDPVRSRQAIQDAWAELDRIDALMTTWTQTSEVSRINLAAGDGKAVPISTELFGVLTSASDASRLSGGAFDVTVGSFSGLWKFDEDKDGSLPDPAAVKARKKLVGWRDLVLDAKATTARLKKKGQKITLGGIAKGYGVDRAVQVLRDAGVVDFIVQAGGDLFVSGRHGDRPWSVGIRNPRGPADDFFAFASIEDRTFSTSGDYERFVLRNGKRYHHILDPRTGNPASLCRSVTVMAKTGLEADRLSKAFFVLGPKKGFALAEKLPDVDAVFVTAKNEVLITSGLRPVLKIVRSPTDAP